MIQSYFSFPVSAYLPNLVFALLSLFSNRIDAKYDLVSLIVAYLLLYLFVRFDFGATCIFISIQILLHSIPTIHSLSH